MATVLDHPRAAKNGPASEGSIDRIGDEASNKLAAHDTVARGLPASDLLELVDGTPLFATVPDALELALGVSLRTVQRRRRETDPPPLTAEQSSRLWKFATILDRATTVFGSRDEAEAWLLRPAIGLDNRRPLDLLATSPGVEAVETLLTRIEYGVYT